MSAPAPSDGIGRGRWLAALALLALATLAAHASSLGNGFIDLDDRMLVDFVRQHSFADYWRQGVLYNYVPVTLTSLGLEARLVGTDPFLYHLDNWLLHALAAVGTAVVLRALRQPVWVSLGVAALFALHPMRVESVAWIAERKALLATVFSLGALRCWIHYADTRSRAAWGGAFAGLALALLSKPSAVGLPLLFLVIDWHRGRGLGARVWAEKLPLLALSVAAGLVTLAVQETPGTSINAGLSWLERVAAAGEAVAFYIARSLVPIGLSGYYQTGVARLPLHDAALAALVAGALHLWLWRHPAQWRDALLGAAWFALFVAPTLRILSFGGLSLYNDRYIYQAAPGLWLVLTLPLRPLASAQPTLRRVAAALGLLWLAALSLASYARGPVWADAESFWRDVLAKVPGSTAAHLQLGERLAARGEHEAALAHYRAGIESQPICGPCFLAMARAHLALGEPEAAGEAVANAVEASPEHLGTLLGAARFHTRLGRTARAIPLLERASRLEAVPPLVELRLGQAYLRVGRSEEARARFEAVLAADPDDGRAALALGKLALAQGRGDEARRLLAQARNRGVAIDPALLQRVGLETPEADRSGAADRSAP